MSIPAAIQASTTLKQDFRWVTYPQIPIHEADITCQIRQSVKPYSVIGNFNRDNGIYVIDGWTGWFEIRLDEEQTEALFKYDDNLTLSAFIQIPGLQKMRICRRTIKRDTNNDD